MGIMIKQLVGWAMIIVLLVSLALIYFFIDIFWLPVVLGWTAYGIIQWILTIVELLRKDDMEEYR